MKDKRTFFTRYWWVFAGVLSAVALATALNIDNTDGWIVVTNSSNESWTVNWNTTRPTICTTGNYSYWTGTGFSCRDDQTGSANLSGYVPYTGATQNVNINGYILQTHGVRSNDSAGLLLESASGTDSAVFGVANTANVLFYGSLDMSTGTSICLGGVCRSSWPADTYANVTAAQADITAIKTVDSTQNNTISTLQSDIAAIKTVDVTQNSSISAAQADITAIKTVDNTQNGSITGVSTFAQTKAATGTVDCGSGNFLRVLTINNGSWTTTCAADQSGGGGLQAYQFSTDFIGIGANSFPPLTGAATSSGTSSNPAPQYGYPGTIYLRDSTTVNGGYRYDTSTTTAFFVGNETFRMIFYIPTTSGVRTGVQGFYGFHDTTTIVQPTDGCYFRHNGTQMRGECRNNAGPTTTATNWTITTNTWYDARITVNSAATSVLFEIYNAAGSQVWNGTVAANIPNTNVRVFGAGIGAWEATTDAAADIIWIDYLKAGLNNAVTIAR